MKKIIYILLLLILAFGTLIVILIQTNELEITMSNWESTDDYHVNTNTIDATLRKFSKIKRSEEGNCLFLSFWDVGCGHCYREIPVLNKIYRQTKSDKVDFFAIASCTEEKGNKALKANKLDFEFTKVFSVSGLRISLRVNIEKTTKITDSLPLTIVLGPDNEVLLFKKGEISEGEVDSIVQLLKSV